MLDGEHWWKWSVWIEGPAEELALVDEVTYRLHPTFPEPLRRVTNKATKFKLTASGWGEVTVSANVRLKDGRPVELERWIELRDSQGRRQTDPEPGEDWRRQLKEKLATADLVAAVIAEPPSTWVLEEAILARKAGRKVVPILLRAARVPDSLADLARFELSEIKNLRGFADRLAAVVKDAAAVPEEG